MTWNPSKDAGAPSAFIDIVNEDDDEEVSEDDNEDFLRDALIEEEAAEENLMEEWSEGKDGALLESSSLMFMMRTSPALYEVNQTTSRAVSAAPSSSPLSSPRLSNGAVSPLTIPYPSTRRDPSWVLASSRSTASSPTPDEPVIIIGQERGRGGRGRGIGSRRGGRVRTYPTQGRIHASAWQRGNPINEIYISDDDVPGELRAAVLAVIGRREARQRNVNRQRVEDDGQVVFFDVEEGDAALFHGEEEALRFDWRPMDSFEGRREPFLVEETGPTKACLTAYEGFSQYWDESILMYIVSETNRYAVGKEWSDWYDTNVHEILVLFSFWMMLGIIRMPTIKSCFSTNYLLATNCFRLMFSRQRYERLCSCLNFNNNALRTPQSSPLFPIEPIISHLNSKFQAAYIPRQEICIDESLTLWKGNLSFRQYIKTNAAKFGIKTFELCESATGYLWSFFVYTGNNSIPVPSLPASLLKSTASVLTLVRPLLNKGYTLFMDNWFNSPLVTRFLKRNKTDVVGSLRPNRQHLPPLITHCELQAGQFLARHSGDMTAMAYFDKKKISLISTYHGTKTAQAPEKPFRTTLWKPQLVLDYNKNMGGIDLKDGMLKPYLLERKRCSKWHIKLFKHFFNVSILNARICLEATTGTHLQHVIFRLQLVEQILNKHLSQVPKPRQASRVALPAELVSNWHLPSTVAKRRADGRTARRRCSICHKQVTFECKSCNVGLCIDQCFSSYHTQTEYSILEPLVIIN